MSQIANLQRCIARLEFQTAFIDTLGWNNPGRAPFKRTVQGRTVQCRPIAEAGGFEVIEVTEDTPPAGSAPLTAPMSRGLRGAVDTEVSKVSTSHVLAFVDRGQGEAVFQVARVRDGKRYLRERPYRPGLPIAPLVAFLGEFAIPYEMLDPTGELPHTKMLDLLDAGSATAEKVSKRFYNDLAAKRRAFEPFLKWIADEEKRAWYVTALLNRLMFIYFVQQKQLVNHDPHYLRHLLETSEKAGKDRFYREYFLPLCFYGFGKPKHERGKYESLFRDVVYLNGGLFALHTVEAEAGVSPDAVADGSLPPEVNIPDAEFRKWFDFFDSWRWTLDEENAEYDEHISPAILGYIFEKYVNKDKGAYYTRDDITDYVCRNTIIPRLFDMLADTGPKGKQAVDPLPIGPHPNLLNGGLGISNGEGIERYVYPAVKTTDTLPTETLREYAARQARFENILSDFEAGKIAAANDFITYNLDIERMAADFVARIQDAQVLHDLYFRCLTKITVLDPTCGSGAFLFAALKVLEPLYRCCLQRMEHFWSPPEEGPAATFAGEFSYVNDVDTQPSFLDPETASNRVKDAFIAELRRFADHPRTYYVTKSIIVNNLYGVDLEAEAVEICKLRLFLRLAAYATPDQTKKNQGIEPLPDIDFNILSGNSLVGFESEHHVSKCLSLFGAERLRAANEAMAAVGIAYERFRRAQTDDTSGKESARLKCVLLDRLAPLREELNTLLAGDDSPAIPLSPVAYAAWRESHRPLHWVAEFFEVIVKRQGFDVVAGNPPYVQWSKSQRQYKVLGYETEACNNLYGYCVERGLTLTRDGGRNAMIVPLSLTFSRDFRSLRALLLERTSLLYLSSYDNIPDRLFTGDKESDNTSKANQQRITIYLSAKGVSPPSVFTAPLVRWKAAERCRLFAEMPIVEATDMCTADGFPKVGTPKMLQFLRRWLSSGHSVGHLARRHGPYRLVVPKTAGYFVSAFESPLNRTQQTSLNFDSEHDQLLATALLNSNAFYWLWRVYGDAFHVTDAWLAMCPVPKTRDSSFVSIGRALLNAQDECAGTKGYNGAIIPNVNFNRRMDLVIRADEWIISQVAPDLGVTPEDFLWAKSNSFLHLSVPRSANYPAAYQWVDTDG